MQKVMKVKLVFIGKLSLSTHRRVPICQGFSHFSGFLHHLVSAKLATSSIRVNDSNTLVIYIFAILRDIVGKGVLKVLLFLTHSLPHSQCA